jgi:hypothetical protein
MDEAARRLGVHKHTVREWIKRGLPAITDLRPFLILGPDLFEFLKGRRTKSKRPCAPGELYCLRCRAPKLPDGDIADYDPVTEISGMLSAICPTCDGMMYQRINSARMQRIPSHIHITLRKAHSHISESAQPSVNSDLRQEH